QLRHGVHDERREGHEVRGTSGHGGSRQRLRLRDAGRAQLKGAYAQLAVDRIYYRDAGEGPPLVFLHGGWGYEVYPFDRQIAALCPSRRVVIPDRTGYGRSPSTGSSSTHDRLETTFHERAAEETRALIDTLGLERPVLWGHSD